MASKPLPTVEEHSIELVAALADAVEFGKQVSVLFAELTRQRDAAIRADERERCAAVCDQVVDDFRSGKLHIGDWTGHEAARRIRALPPLPPEGEGE